ncbi:MAG: hypothetical protein AB7S26_21235 [Sandaracinaceae bacterium]
MPRAWPSPAQAPRRWIAAAVLAVGLSAASAPASAQLGRALGDPSGASIAPVPPGWTFDLSATTSFPISVGVEGQLTSPVGVFVYASVGHTPEAYLSGLTDIVAGPAHLRPSVRPMLNEIIGNGGWNLRLGVGYTIPEGLELSAGYTLLAAASRLTPEAIEQATGQNVRWPGMTDVPLNSVLHAFHGRVGWRFVVEEHFVLRATIGWVHVFAAQASVEVPTEVRTHPRDPAGQFESRLADGMRSGYTPELALSAGYRF